jgi:hypothetical protein
VAGVEGAGGGRHGQGDARALGRHAGQGALEARGCRCVGEARRRSEGAAGAGAARARGAVGEGGAPAVGGREGGVCAGLGRRGVAHLLGFLRSAFFSSSLRESRLSGSRPHGTRRDEV